MGADELALRQIIRRLHGAGEQITPDLIYLWGAVIRHWPPVEPGDHEVMVSERR